VSRTIELKGALEIPLALHGVVPRYKKGHIPAITKPPDIGPLAPATNEYRSPITRAALKLAMYTELRPSVIAAVPGSETNLDAAESHIPGERMTMQHDHIVPLPRQAVAVLNELKLIVDDSLYVFPSPARQKTPHLHRDALSKVLRDMGFRGNHGAYGFLGMLRTVGRERLGNRSGNLLEAEHLIDVARPTTDILSPIVMHSPSTMPNSGAVTGDRSGLPEPARTRDRAATLHGRCCRLYRCAERTKATARRPEQLGTKLGDCRRKSGRPV